MYISEVNYHGPNSIVVQLGNVDGTFQAPIESDTAAAFPDSLVLRDFNGDGILDVALVDGNFDFETGNGGLYVHIGNKNGTFQPGVAYPISVGGRNSDLITADLSGDKILDLVVSGTYGTAVLIGAKRGTLGTSTIYKYGGGSVAVADMNQDGKLDLIAGPNGTCSYGCQVSVLLGNGDGTFGTVVSTPVYGNFNGLSLVTGDFNHDDRTDIAFGNGWAGIEVLLGNGAGGFNTPFHTYGSFTTVQYGGPVLLTGDYNLDGQLDLVSLPYPFTGQSFSILSGNGDGTFGAEQDLAAGSGPSTVVTGDFNDAKLDLAVTSGFTSGTGVGVFLGKENGTFKPALVTVETGATGPMVSGDFNHDGKPDLALVNKDNTTVSILLGTGTGAFTAAHTYSVSKTGAVSAIAAADFNHDGNFDLVLVDTLDSTAWVLLGNSDGTFHNATSWNTYYGGCYSVAVADLNDDGNPDIAAKCGYTYISLLFGNGDGTFSSPAVVYDPSAGTSGFNVALADLQGNGVYDLIGSHLNNLLVALGASNGGFPSSWIQNWGGGYSESLGTPTAIADFNNDGKVDIAEAGLNSFAASRLATATVRSSRK